ncbi:MAG TPA: ATP-binding protein, partial [Polyangiaceae bacterium]|nr:ATP-binding protein [Polyangiaceae bacterium]
VLVLGPVWGWAVCGLMLVSFAGLAATTALPLRYDLLRFIDEVAMTLFAAGLGHSLVRSFAAYEAAIAKRHSALLALREKRQAMTVAIYEQLEPLAAKLVQALPRQTASDPERAVYKQVLDGLIENLSQAKTLAQRDDSELGGPGTLDDPDRVIRRGAMRAWLRLAAGLMAFFVVRNLLAHVPFVPSLVSFCSCLLFDFWLRRPQSATRLEATALAIGVCASVPMIAHIHAYGANADAPPLVVMPATVLFTALLSRGPATWATVALNGGILAWAGSGQILTLAQSRLLGDLALSFLLLLLALGRVFALRKAYVVALLAQGQAMTEALRQHRRLAGTLFHDVSNHLLVLSLHLELNDSRSELPGGPSLTRRVQRLITLSKDFLLGADSKPSLTPVALSTALDLLNEAFALHLERKQLRFEAGPGMDLCVSAQSELLIESVLGNLLSNAVKFSSPGSVITLHAERIGPDVRIVLSDAGPGLPPEVLQRLGQEGAVPSQIGTAGEQGQGYGLQLAREHLERMDGNLQLENPKQGGMQAIIRLRAA